MSILLPEAVAAWAADPENQQGADLLRAQGAAAERERLSSEHQAALASARAEGVAAGAAAERDRARGVREVVVPGFEALVETLAGDGQTTPEQAAMAICAAMREQASAAATANAVGAPAPVPFAAAPSVNEEGHGTAPAVITSEDDDQRIAAAAAEYQAQNPGVSFMEALKSVTKGGI